MIRDMKYVYLGMNYIGLKDLLIKHKKLTVFPLVDNPQTMTLLGSIPRSELIRLLDQQMGAANRRQILPSPKVYRVEDEEEPVEIIPMRKKSHMTIIDDSSDSEKEDGDKTNKTVEEFKLEKTNEIKKPEVPSLKENTQQEVSSITLILSTLIVSTNILLIHFTGVHDIFYFIVLKKVFKMSLQLMCLLAIHLVFMKVYLKIDYIWSI